MVPIYICSTLAAGRHVKVPGGGSHNQVGTQAVERVNPQGRSLGEVLVRIIDRSCHDKSLYAILCLCLFKALCAYEHAMGLTLARPYLGLTHYVIVDRCCNRRLSLGGKWSFYSS